VASISKYGLLVGGSPQENSVLAGDNVDYKGLCKDSNVFLCSDMQHKNTVK
jgi:hypothetical protein